MTEGSVPATKKKGSRWLKVRVILAALVLVIGFTLYLSWRNGLPPTVVQELASGQTYLDVPLMTMYTPSLAVPGFATEANVTFAASTSYATRFTFTWGAVNGTSLPVRFVMIPSPSNDSGSSFAPAASNGFLFFPAGQASGATHTTGFSTVKSGAEGLVSELWRMDYVVREMSVHDWFGEDRWIEVNYALTIAYGRIGDLPAANTTAPLPGDLIPLGAPLVVSYGAGYPWSYRWSIRDVSLPAGGFHHAAGAVALDAGTAGTIHTILGCAFEWGPDDDYQIHASGSGPANLSLQLLVDMRFGSLLVKSTG